MKTQAGIEKKIANSMMRRMTALCVAWLVCVGLFGQQVETFRLWEGQEVPSDNGIRLPQIDKDVYWENVTEAVLTVYRPERPNGLAVLACPGGSYEQVWEREFHRVAQWYNEQGILLAILRYRLPNGHQEIPLEDVHQAMRILRSHQEEYGYELLGVHGNSAGGHLAATAATLYGTENLRPDFQILFYPVITMDGECCHRASRKNLMGETRSADDVQRYSLELQVTKQTPPAFIAASGDDSLVPVGNSLAYYEALMTHHVPAAMHLYPTGNHGWFDNKNFLYRQVVMDELKSWLESLATLRKVPGREQPSARE